ncbi:MAG: hypothetical protein ACPGJV_15065 [Bacteriovoracaceae bacterium]
MKTILKTIFALIPFLILSFSTNASIKSECSLEKNENFKVEFFKTQNSYYGYLANIHGNIDLRHLQAYAETYSYSWPPAQSASRIELFKKTLKRLGANESLALKVDHVDVYSLFLSDQHTDPGVILSIYKDSDSKSLIKILYKERKEIICKN